MSKNYMREVAEILGVEFERDFIIKDRNNNPYQIKGHGLVDCNNDYNKDLLMNLLIGCADIDNDILTEKEREYLSGVIAPKSIYKNVDYIVKNQIGKYFRIVIIDKKGVLSRLPCFANDNMYKGMDIGTIYTLEELGLSKYE